jgi:protein-tyrosine-phosphatase
MSKALVIGEDTRSFLSVIRSLGKIDVTVDVICYDQTSPSLSSRYINKAWYFNYQSYSVNDWLEKVIALIDSEQYDLVFPCDERAIFPLFNAREKISQQCKLALPNKEVRDSLFDKHLTKKVAIECGVRVAKGKMHSIENETYHSLSKYYSACFVIKPTESFNEDKLSSRNKVAIVTSEDEYNDYLSQSDIKNQQFLIEEYFTGTGEGISLFACNGKVQYLFAHTRVNEPRTGGGSSYRKAIPIDPAMAEACVAICKATQYDGVGMFEFKKNYTTNEWILVEVNARFWGSLPLAIHAGIDFPAHYAQYLLGQYEERATPSTKYNVNAYARSFSNDMYDIRAEMQYLTKKVGIAAGVSNLFKRLATYYRVFGHEKIDSFDRNDKQPFLTEFKQLANATVIDKIASKLPIKHNAELMNELMRLMYTLEGKGRLVFVCYGNIMRSPIAGVFSDVFMQNTSLGFDVASYGFHQNTGRCSPETCQQAASALGLDLSKHRSKLLLQKELTDNDIVFIFDQHNRVKLDKFYQAKHVFNLADFVPSGLGKHRAIDDPYGHGEDAVQQCYLLIIEALKAIFERYLSLK